MSTAHQEAGITSKGLGQVSSKKPQATSHDIQILAITPWSGVTPILFYPPAKKQEL